MMARKLLSRQPLDNGLTLELWNLSRPVAGDRWQVVLEARVAIPLTDATRPRQLKENLPELRAALGPEVVFSQKEVRHFIANREVEGLLEEMASRLVSSLKSYLGHPEFPQDLSARCLRNTRKNRACIHREPPPGVPRSGWGPPPGTLFQA